MKLKTSNLTKVPLCAGLTAALAWVYIPLPFSPVPITGQTLGIMISGSFLPPPLAALSQLVYILLGALGIPVFSGGNSGLAHLLGPTGGYIWSFVPAALTIAWLTHRFGPQTIWGHLVIFAVGSVGIVYTAGVLHLMIVTDLSLQQALNIGVLPILVGDCCKVVLGASLIKRLRNMVQK